MRILIANANHALAGGAETYIRELIPGLRERGHKVGVLVEKFAPSGQPTLDREGGVPIWELTTQDRSAVAKELSSWSPDVCFLHGLYDTLQQEWLAETFPTVLFAHNHHGTCISGTKRFAFPGEEVCHRRFGLGCLALYLPRRCGGLNPLAMIRGYQGQAARLRLLSKYRAMVVSSRYMVDEYRRHGVPSEKLHRLPLFPTDSNPDHDPPADRPIMGELLVIARLTETKGVHHAIAALRPAASRLGRHLRLTVAGEGPERERLEEMSRRLKADVRFVGWVGADERNRLIRSADLLILPSTCPESFGLIGPEAGCVGLPTAAFTVGGVPDWLTPGVSGELAPANPATPDGLVDAIVRALRSPDHWASLRRGAWETAKRFTRSAHLDGLEHLFQAVAK